MEITNELLAAYAEGHVSTEERDAVRKYLAENPSELESIMMMMDEDYEIEPITEEDCGEQTLAAAIAETGAAYVSGVSCMKMMDANLKSISHVRMRKNGSYRFEKSFENRLDDLLGEIGSLK